MEIGFTHGIIYRKWWYSINSMRLRMSTYSYNLGDPGVLKNSWFAWDQILNCRGRMTTGKESVAASRLDSTSICKVEGKDRTPITASTWFWRRPNPEILSGPFLVALGFFFPEVPQAIFNPDQASGHYKYQENVRIQIHFRSDSSFIDCKPRKYIIDFCCYLQQTSSLDLALHNVILL